MQALRINDNPTFHDGVQFLEAGDHDKFQKYINHFAAMTIKDDTLLHNFTSVASKNNASNLIRALKIKREDLINKIISENSIHSTVMKGHKYTLSILLKIGVNPNSIDCQGKTPLYYAVEKNMKEIFEMLLNAGADAMIGPSLFDLNNDDFNETFNRIKGNIVVQMARNGYKDIVKYLNKDTVNMRSNDSRKSTPLHLAAGYNRLDIVKLLIDKGADIYAKDSGGLIPLHNAASYGHVEVCRFLLDIDKKQLDTVDAFNFTPFHEAASKNRIDVCSLLIQYGVDIFQSCMNENCGLNLISKLELREQLLYEYIGNAYLRAIQSSEGSISLNMFLNLNNKILDKAKHNLISPSESIKKEHQFTNRLHDPRLSTIIGKDPLLWVDEESNENLLHSICKFQKFTNYTSALEVVEILVKRLKCPFTKKTTSGETVIALALKNKNSTLLKFLLVLQEHFKTDPKLRKFTNYYKHFLGIEEPTISLASDETFDELCVKLNIDLKQVNVCELYYKLVKCGILEGHSLGPVKALETSRHHFFEACKSGDYETVEKCLKTILNAGLSTCLTEFINTPEPNGRFSTALHFAAGHNRYSIAELLIKYGADINARDKGGLVPLHNACSYGHLRIVKLLVENGAIVDAMDNWEFTPLHEAAFKKKLEICHYLVAKGANIRKKNRDGQTPIDLVPNDVISGYFEILGGCAELLDAAKRGDLDKLTRLLIQEKINFKDDKGRNSTLLHLASGYNHKNIVEFLLDNGACVNSRDKGGLIPLHNASSYGHCEIASILLKHGAHVNSIDKWGYTPLHEAALKGRTQLCTLLICHGADVTAKNLDQKTPLDLATAEDVKSLIRDAMPKNHAVAPKFPINTFRDGHVPALRDECQGLSHEIDPNSQSNQFDVKISPIMKALNLESFLRSINMFQYYEIFIKERITMDVLVDLSHDDLKSIGIDAFGHRHKILKGVKRLKEQLKNTDTTSRTNCTGVESFDTTEICSLDNREDFQLFEIDRNDLVFIEIESRMIETIRVHKQNHGGIFNSYKILKICKIQNSRLLRKYLNRCTEIMEENNGILDERKLFHGSPFVDSIVEKGFDERYACIQGMFGAGIYFAEDSSKSNQYVYGINGGSGCISHQARSCYLCPRNMLLCRVALGKKHIEISSNKLAHAPPGHHSIYGKPTNGGLLYPEYVIYRGEQAFPDYLITYLIRDPNEQVFPKRSGPGGP